MVRGLKNAPGTRKSVINTPGTGKSALNSSPVLATPPLVVGNLREVGVNYYSLMQQAMTNASFLQTTIYTRFALLKANGIRLVRFNASGAFYATDPAWTLYRTNPAAYWAVFDAVVKIAGQYNLLLVPSMFWNLVEVGGVVRSIYGTTETYESFADPRSVSVRFMQQYATEMVLRYRASSVICMWQFGNELNLSIDLPNYVPTATAPVRLTTDHLVSMLSIWSNTVLALDSTHPLTAGFAEPRASAYNQYTSNTWTTDTAVQARAHLTKLTANLGVVEGHNYTPASLPTYLDTLALPVCTASKKIYYAGEFGVFTAYTPSTTSRPPFAAQPPPGPGSVSESLGNGYTVKSSFAPSGIVIECWPPCALPTADSGSTTIDSKHTLTGQAYGNGQYRVRALAAISATFAVSKAFDDVDTSFWIQGYRSPVTNPAWLEIQLPAFIVLTGYSFKYYTDTSGRPMTAWNVAGSRDLVNWVTLDSRTDAAMTASYTVYPRSYAISARPEAYRYYRINNTGDLFPGIAKFVLYGFQRHEYPPTPFLPGSATVTSSNAATYTVSNQPYGNGTYTVRTPTVDSTNTNPVYAFDDEASTAWISGNASPCILDVQLPESIVLEGYSLSNTAGIANSRSSNTWPVAWTVSGSADGATWTPLDSRTVDPAVLHNRGAKHRAWATSPGLSAYPWYRFQVTMAGVYSSSNSATTTTSTVQNCGVSEFKLMANVYQRSASIVSDSSVGRPSLAFDSNTLTHWTGDTTSVLGKTYSVLQNQAFPPANLSLTNMTANVWDTSNAVYITTHVLSGTAVDGTYETQSKYTYAASTGRGVSGYAAFDGNVLTNQQGYSSQYYAGNGAVVDSFNKFTAADSAAVVGNWNQIRVPQAFRMTSYQVYGTTSVYNRAFTVCGSVDGVAWDIIDIRASQTWASNSYSVYTPPYLPRPYTYIRYSVNEQVGSSDNSARIFELKYYGTMYLNSATSTPSVQTYTPYPPVPLTAATTTSSAGVVTTTSTVSGTFADGTYTTRATYASGITAFDESPSTAWGAQSGKYSSSTGAYMGSATTTASAQTVSGDWIQLQLPASVFPARYSLYKPSSGAFPRSWTLCGSVDGATWTILDTQVNYAYIASNEQEEFSLSTGSSFYSSYILCIQTMSTGTTAASVVDFKVYGKTTLASHWLQLSTPAAVKPTAFTLDTRRSGASGAYAGPTAYWLLGSKDETSWDVLRYKTATQASWVSTQTITFEATIQKSHAHYRVLPKTVDAFCLSAPSIASMTVGTLQTYAEWLATSKASFNSLLDTLTTRSVPVATLWVYDRSAAGDVTDTYDVLDKTSTLTDMGAYVLSRLSTVNTSRSKQ